MRHNKVYTKDTILGLVGDDERLINIERAFKMSKTNGQDKETLESYKSKVKLQTTKVHYRYALALTAFTVLVIGLILGYFVAISQITEAQSRVVNSIQVSLKDPAAQ